MGKILLNKSAKTALSDNSLELMLKSFLKRKNHEDFENFHIFSQVTNELLVFKKAHKLDGIQVYELASCNPVNLFKCYGTFIDVI